MALSISIAGELTAEDWQNRKKKLNSQPSPKLWEETFDEFLMKRLSLRYLDPIKSIQEEGKAKGEGFAVVSIQCALIEFLAALKKGKNYKFKSKGVKLGDHEYSGSRKLFCCFLQTESPFKEWFRTKENAEDFYANVRCALLHEAMTKGGWRIWATDGAGVNVQNKLVRRDELQKGITCYLKMYGELLSKDSATQKAFIRKFDHLAADN